MRNSHVLLLMSAALLGVVLWLSFEDSTSAAELDASTDAVAARPSDRPAGDLADTPTSATDSNADRNSRAALTASDAEFAETEAVERGLEVLAEQRVTFEPLTIDAAWWWEEALRVRPGAETTFDEALSESRVEELSPTRATALTPDAEGRWFTPSLDREGYVVLRSGEWWGCGFVRRGAPDPHRVQLVRDSSLSVKVIDAAKQPVAGVRVAYRQRWSDDEDEALVTARTDQRGLAVLRHLREFDDGMNTLSLVRTVALAEPFLSAPSANVDVTRMPTEPIELRLPAFGSVEVRVVDRRSLPFLGPFEVFLECAPEHVQSPDESSIDRRRHRLRTRDGKVVFPWVGVGGPIVVTGGAIDSSSWAESVLVPGPARAGDHVVVQLPIDPSPPAIVARLLDESGRPAADRVCEVAVETAEGRDEIARCWEARTDGDGRLKAPLQFESETPLNVVVRVHDDSDALAWFARQPLAILSLDRTVDIGDVRLKSAPVLAEGRVVGPDGVGVRGASLAVHTMRTYRLYEGGERIEWEQRWRLEARTTADGAFRVLGELSDTTFALTADAYGLSGALTGISSGARDLVIELAPTGALCGRVEGALDGLIRNLDVVVAREAEDRASSPRATEVQYVEVAETGEFCARNLVPGRYSVYVEPKTTVERMAFVEDVLVAAGETTVDRRLNPLDISDNHAVLLTVIEPGGAPVREWQAAEDGEDDGERWTAWCDSAIGRALVSPPDDVRRVLVWSEQHAITPLVDLRGERTVVLERATSVSVKLRDGLAPPPAPFHLCLSITAEGEPSWLNGWIPDQVELSDRGVGELLVHRSGRLEVQLEVLDANGDESVTILASIVEGERLLPGAKSHTMRIAYDPAELASAVESLRR